MSNATLTADLKPKTKLKLEKNTIKYAEKLRELEAKNSIIPFKDSNAVFRKLPGILFEYQKKFIEAALNSVYECLVWEKSRRIGATHALAAFAVLEASKGKNPKNFFYIGTSLPMARDFISSCAYWCKHFNVIAKTRDHPIIDKESENILVLRITFKSGKRIEALSSRPESMRGRQGHTLLDEAAFVTGLSEFLKACMAMQIWKCKVFILSTHNGVDNPFNQLCEEIRKGEKEYYLQRTTLREAVNQGLYERICLMEGIPHTLEEQRRWLEKLYHDAGDAATEEYDAIPKVTNPNAIFKPEMFQRVQKSELPTGWDCLLRFWDMAATDNKNSCYTVSSLDLANFLNSTISGAAINQYREKRELIEIRLRGDQTERLDVASLSSLAIPTSRGTSVPLAQIAHIEYRFEEGLIWHRNRLPTITVRGDIRSNLQPATVVAELSEPMAALREKLPNGYLIEVGGTVEESARGQKSVNAGMPFFLAVVMTLLMIQLRSMSRAFIVFLTAPLGIIGVVLFLLLFNKPFGFVAMLGTIALSGMIMRNSLILIDQIEQDIRAGESQWDAIINATVRRCRPIVLTALAAVLAMIPLSRSIFFGPMAVAIMGGLIVATLLTLFFLPALYAQWFKVKKNPHNL